MMTLTVQFPGTAKNYNYWYEPNSSNAPKIGDKAVVQVGNELKIVDIHDIVPGSQPEASKFAIAVFNLEEHKTRQDKAQRRKALLARLEQLASEQAQLERFKALAEANWEAKALLEELQA